MPQVHKHFNDISHFRKRLNDDWQEFVHKMDQGDFWGLKSDNNRRGVDGSTWNVTGYKKNSSNNSSPQHHFVHRWGETTLQEAFEFATLLAGNKKGCFWIRKKQLN